ncbi:hypothetical protein AVEN_230968-1 [Araneus ventricosus]|uniref:Uncharacterized protein n=1 Tax=Araneus ventricosus TaxID=182803 RepID=A0A4Y2A2Z8_ARAVE|nr:hypothetical protein AVEN_230968-1 [Araneus ventricosus]
MRCVGSDIPLSSPELESSFPSIPEVSSPPPSDKELPPVFPESTGEIEPSPRPVERTPPTAMTPEPNHRQCTQMQQKVCLVFFIEEPQLEKINVVTVFKTVFS